MKKILYVLIICAFFANWLPAETNYEDASNQFEALAEKVNEFLPKLKALGNEYPNNVEIQLGIAKLYETPGARTDPNMVIEYDNIAQYDKILAIEPDNRPALAQKTWLICNRFVVNRNGMLEYLESVINAAKEHGMKQLTIPDWGDELYQYLGKKEQRSVVFDDFDTPVELLKEKIDKEIPSVIAVIENGQSKDPNNALYNYLRAYLLFNLGDTDMAVSEVETAIKKPYWNNYIVEAKNAELKVLQEVGFPEAEKNTVRDTYSPSSIFLSGKIWRKGLEPLGDFYKKEGNLDKARKMYNLAIGIAKHIKEEPVQYEYHAENNQKTGENIENKAQQYIKDINK